MTTRFARQRTKREKRKPILIYFLFGILVLAGLATLYIWQRMETVRLVKGIKVIEEQIAQIDKTKEYLAIQVTRLSSPEYICLRAQKDLGFTTTDIDRQIALADPVETAKWQIWQQFLAQVKEYGKKAWHMAEPEAVAGESK
jgi:cell division protein FtsL